MTTIPGTTEQATVTWQAMTPTPWQEGTTTVTWAPLDAHAFEGIDGIDVSNNSEATVDGSEVADAVAGASVSSDLSVSSNTDWNVAGTDGAMTYLVSTLPPGTPTNAMTGGYAGMVEWDGEDLALPTAVITNPGSPGVITGTESVGGETVSGTGSFTAAQVADAAAGQDVPGLSVTQAASAWTVTPGPTDGTTLFTSTTPDAAVAAPDVGAATGDATAPTYILTTQGTDPLVIPPAVTSVGVPADGDYGTGQNLTFTVTFSQPVVVTGTPALEIGLPSGYVPADYVNGSGSDTLTFQLPVQSDEQARAGIGIGFLFDNTNGTIDDTSSNPADLSLNGVPSLAGIDINVPPSVTSVNAASIGDFGAGQALIFTANFSEPVTVNTDGGTPTLPLVLSPQDTVQAQYLSGSGTDALTFAYVVAPGDLSQGTVNLGSAINLNGGTIEDAYGNPLASSLAQVTAPASVTVDGVPPSLSPVNVIFGYEGMGELLIPAPSDNNFSAEQLTATVTALPTNGTLALGSAPVTQGEALTVSQLQSLVFTATPGESGSSSFGYSVTDPIGNTASASNPITVRPAVTSVAVPADGTYGPGSNLSFAVTFSEPVNVTGTPLIPVQLTTAAGPADAVYAGGSGTNTLIFQLPVLPGEQDLTGIGLAEAIVCTGGTIESASGTLATLALDGVPSTAGIDIDAVPTTVTSVSLPPAGSYPIGSDLNFTVHLTEPVTVNTSSGTPSIAVALADGPTVQASYIAGSGTDALTFQYVVTPSLTVTSGISIGSTISLNGGSMQDIYGNPVVRILPKGASDVVVDGVRPVATVLEAPGATLTNASTLDFIAEFSKQVSGVGPADFQPVLTGTLHYDGLKVRPDGLTGYGIELSGVTGSGTARLELVPNQAEPITDQDGNTVTAPFTGQAYTVVQTPPAISSGHLTVPYAGSASLAIPAPVDAAFGPAQLTATVTALPSDGSVLLGDGVTPVTQGEHLTMAQLTSLSFDATPGTNGTSSFGYRVSDPLNNMAEAADSITVLPIASPVFTTSDEVTNTATPSFTGTAMAGSTVSLEQGGVVIGSTVAASDGKFTVAPAAALFSGENTLTATASLYGETSTQSAPLSDFILPSPVNEVSTTTISTATLAAALGGGASLNFMAGTETVALQDGVLSVGPDTNEATIQRLYQGLLGRPGDLAGLSFFDAQLSQGGSAADVATEILNSPEYIAHQGTQTPQQLVDTLFEGLLGRSAASDPGGSSFWVNLLAQGTSPGAVAAGIANSAESKTYLASAAAQVYVPNSLVTAANALYETGLGRAADPAALASMLTMQASLTPAELAANIAGSTEFATDHAGQTGAALVNSLFEAGLGRAADPVGGAFWTAKLTGGASVASVLLGIATSPEAAAHNMPSLAI